MSTAPLPQDADWAPHTVFTVGHSTLPIDEFTARLHAYGIESLMDVRSVPRSRHNPQFWAEAMHESLPQAGIEYVPMQSLGGLRRAHKDSPNTGWRNTSFRGYADYMQTPEFAAALEDLMTAARRRRCAIMCAEAVPWRCHRSLVADALLVHGFPVIEIMTTTSYRPHQLTRFAQVQGERITYPPGPEA